MADVFHLNIGFDDNPEPTPIIAKVEYHYGEKYAFVTIPVEIGMSRTELTALRDAINQVLEVMPDE